MTFCHLEKLFYSVKITLVQKGSRKYGKLSLIFDEQN